MTLQDTIHSALNKYSDECSKGLIASPPSRLNRGEGTEVEYLLMKIDLVQSTHIFQRKSPTSYMQFSHIYLSTLDELVAKFGAQQDQTEYAGDSVLAYFPNTNNMALSVIWCAAACKYAVSQIRFKDSIIDKFSTRIVLHHSKLVVANIGPWGNRQKKAMGIALHKMAAIEEKMPANTSHITIDFAKHLHRDEIERYLSTETRKEAVNSASAITSWTTPIIQYKDVVDHYRAKWLIIYKDLGLTL